MTECMEISFNEIIKVAKWKLRSYGEYKASGYINVNLPFILKDLFSKNSRKDNYKYHEKMMRKRIVEDPYGLFFSENTPSGSLREVFEERIYSQFDDFTPKAGSTIVDVGAQYGDFALLCSKIYNVARVFSFEPLPRNYGIMTENLKLNNTRNITLYNYGLGNIDGKIMSSFTHNMINNFGDGKEQVIELKRLDDFEIRDIDLMKIDVEGFEVDVLQGSMETIKKFHPKIIIETHTKELKRKVIEALSRIGYKIAHEGRTVLVDSPHMDEIQNLFFQRT